MTHKVETVRLAEKKHKKGFSNREVRRQVNRELKLNLGIRTINRWVLNFKHHGIFGPMNMKGDNHAIDAHAEFILKLVEAKLDISLEAIRDRMASVKDFHCCLNTIRDFLARCGVAPPLERKRICRERRQKAAAKSARTVSDDNISKKDYAAARAALDEKYDSVEGDFGDKRKGNALKYPVRLILFICMLAVQCGYTRVDAIARFADAKRNLLHRLLGLASAPSEWTIRRVLKSLDTEQVIDMLFGDVSLLSAFTLGALGVDGKIMRGTVSQARELAGKGIVIAFNPVSGLTERIAAYGRGLGEIPAVRTLLEKMNIMGKWVTADAAHLQVETAKLIIEKGGHYLIALRGNQGGTFKRIMKMIADRKGRHDGQCFAESKGHGRQVKYYVKKHIIPKWVAELLHIPHVKMVLQITTVCSETGFDMRHYLLSEVIDVEYAFQLAREHWLTESNNWQADVTLREDLHKMYDEDVALVIAGLRRNAINVATASDFKDTICGILQRASMCNKFLIGLIINHKTCLINRFANIEKVKQV